MLKKGKALICLALVLMILFASTVPVCTAYKNCTWKSKDFTSTGYKYVGEKTNGIYRYDIYYCKDSNGKKVTGILYYTGAFLTPVMSHVKGKAGKTVAGEYTKELTFSSAMEWNTQVGASVGCKGVAEVSAGVGCGVNAGWAVSESFAKSYSLNESELKDAPTGHYAIAAGKPQVKMHWNKYNWITKNKKGESNFFMHYGKIVATTVYSKDDQQTWRIYS